MQHEHRQAQLFLNGRPVGTVTTESSANAWGCGHFSPAAEFGQFAALFGGWSLLIHEEEDRRASREALEEMRAAERAIDALRAELLWLDSHERTRLRMITIDGPLIEWTLDTVVPS